MIAVTVTLVLDCHPWEVADAVNEILREQQRSWVAESCLLDYSTGPAVILSPTDEDCSDYCEGNAFV